MQFYSEQYRSSHPEVFCKKVFLVISQNSQEKTCVRVPFLIRPATLLKKKLWHRCFTVNFAKFLRTPLDKYCFSLHKYWNFTFFPSVEILRKRTVSAEFRAIPQNFQTRKISEIGEMTIFAKALYHGYLIGP